MKESLCIGVFLDNEEHEAEVCSALLSEGRLNPICYFTSQEFLADCINSRLDGAVIGVDESVRPNYSEVRALVKRLEPLPFILVTTKLYKRWKVELAMCSNVFLFQHEQLATDLAGAAYRLASPLQSLERNDPRTKISMIRAGFLSLQNRGTCLITDISRGGAGAIIHNNDIQVGDHIQLFFPVSGEFSIHQAYARVCWESPFSNDGGHLKRVGFEFTRVQSAAA